jgi:hypothetical protein
VVPTDALAGQDCTKVGGTKSVTLTLKVHVEVSITASRPVHVTVETPRGSEEPLAGAHVKVGAAAPLSVTIGAGYATFTAIWPLTGDWKCVAGHVMLGATTSLAVTVKVQDELLLALSNAMQVTGVTWPPRN